MKLVTLVIGLCITVSGFSQDLPFLKQREMNATYWQTDFGFYDRLDPLTYLRFASPANGSEISFKVAPDTDELEKARHISWKEPATENWLTPEYIAELLPLIKSGQPCLPAVSMYSSNSCHEISTVGKEACQILLANEDQPYPNKCSVISDSEWDKLIFLVNEKYGE